MIKKKMIIIGLYLDYIMLNVNKKCIKFTIEHPLNNPLHHLSFKIGRKSIRYVYHSTVLHK